MWSVHISSLTLKEWNAKYKYKKNTLNLLKWFASKLRTATNGV